MADLEDVQHDILLIITVSLFIFFVTGIGTAPGPAGAPIIIPG